MRVLYVTADEEERSARLLADEGCGVDLVSPGSVVERLRSGVDALAVADAIVLGLSLIGASEGEGEQVIPPIRLARALRELPASSAMPDGRRWNRVPIVILGWRISSRADLGEDVHVYRGPRRRVLPGLGPAEFVADVGELDDDLVLFMDDIVEDYHRRIVDDYRDLGFLITEDHGRLQLSPALKPREPVESELYYGPADRRDRSRYITIHRDFYGISYEAEELEALINRKDVTEPELQKFFERHPHFLTSGIWSRAISHPRLPLDDRKSLVPDFVLEPIIAERRARDLEWQILDLKRPQERLVVGSERRRRLTSEVMKAIAQLRDYGEYFADPQHAKNVERALGHPVRRPQLAVLIGRDDGEHGDVLDAEGVRHNVRLVTYDEILDRQIALLQRRG